MIGLETLIPFPPFLSSLISLLLGQEGMWKDYPQKRKRKSSRRQKCAIKTNIPEGVCPSTLQIASMVGKKCHYTTHKPSEKENVFK